MRCYFMKGGRISSVHIFERRPSSDEEAIRASLELFLGQTEAFESFELWDRDRKVYQHEPEARPNAKGSKKAPAD